MPIPDCRARSCRTFTQMRSMASEPYILMLGQDRDDQQLTIDILNDLGLDLPLRFVPGSARLYAALEEQVPILVLLDFNLKPETGLDILEAIRARPEWRAIPVVLLGDSRDAAFVGRCYAAGANSYVVKPSSLEGTRRVIGGFFTYWLQVAETPMHSAEPNPIAR
ncbi:response regulator [Flaviaesturariibacter aridisoli]|uniref:Response regulator n=2 Tax=Flaviaesturariibacter aridisoli TaxID=2545761 RepID=A0A4R4E0V9_9BACT|nr:response regulator [Flaviaesturariibacter aridisoli]